MTNHQRLQQVLRNLLSNVFEFTEGGSIRLNVAAGWSPDQQILDSAGTVVAFEVSDTGVGLAISCELSKLLGGEIALRKHDWSRQYFYTVSTAQIRRCRTARPRAR